MSGFAYYNGEFYPLDGLSIPITNRAFYFGDAVYEVFLGVGEAVYQCEEHISRLFSNLRKLSIPLLYNKEEITALISHTMKKSGIGESLVYLQVSRCAKERRHSALNTAHDLLITVSPYSLKPSEERISLITHDDLRYYYCDIKTVNLLPSVIASTEAEKAKADEAVLHRGDTVTECAHSNIAILKGNRLLTHPANNLILPGITRKNLLKACVKERVPFEERPFTVSEMMEADEIIVTSTTRAGRLVGKIDGKSVGGRATDCGESLCKILYEQFAQFKQQNLTL